jgi:hypothetical protein
MSAVTIFGEVEVLVVAHVFGSIVAIAADAIVNDRRDDGVKFA